jgi:hypothetical protein
MVVFTADQLQKDYLTNHPGSKVKPVPNGMCTARDFCSYTIDFYDGKIALWANQPNDDNTPLFEWQDPYPLPGVTTIGLSCWSTPVTFRNVQVGPSVMSSPSDASASSDTSAASTQPDATSATSTAPATAAAPADGSTASSDSSAQSTLVLTPDEVSNATPNGTPQCPICLTDIQGSDVLDGCSTCQNVWHDQCPGYAAPNALTACPVCSATTLLSNIALQLPAATAPTGQTASGAPVAQNTGSMGASFAQTALPVSTMGQQQAAAQAAAPAPTSGASGLQLSPAQQALQAQNAQQTAPTGRQPGLASLGYMAGGAGVGTLKH